MYMKLVSHQPDSLTVYSIAYERYYNGLATATSLQQKMLNILDPFCGIYYKNQETLHGF